MSCPILPASAAGVVPTRVLQIGQEPVKRSVLLPQPLPLRRSGVRKGEMTGVECQGPAITDWQAAEARHRGPVETLGDHLVEGEHAALTGAFGLRERDGRDIQLCGIRSMTVAGLAMADGAVLTE